MKSIPVWVLGLSICLCSSDVLAHGVLGRETKVVGDYQIVMESSADVPDPLERFPITYAFLLLNKDGSQYAPFDSARVMLAEKKGGAIVNVFTTKQPGGIPGVEVEAAMPRAGDYIAQVTFTKGTNEIGKSSFDFPIVPWPGAATPAAEPPQVAPKTEPVPRYVWALLLFVAGIALGKFGGRIYEWAF
jgi:hypothetical protein